MGSRVPCFWCGLPYDRLTLDHLTPKGVGGGDGPDNLVRSCADCNRERGAVVARAVEMARLTHEDDPRPARLAAALGLDDAYLSVQLKWAVAETLLLGWSPTARLNVLAPRLGEVRHVPGNKPLVKSLRRKLLDDYRRATNKGVT